jgi:hypothetical protein
MAQPNSPASSNLWSFLNYLFANQNNLLVGGFPGNTWYVDTVNGNSSDCDGNTWGTAYATVAQALASSKLQSGDRIFLRGNIREQVTTPVNIFDVSFIGVPINPRNSDAVSGYFAQTSTTWRPPASPTAATPLCKVIQQGWTFENILFGPGVTDAASVQLFRNAAAGNLERDASHATFRNCRFTGGNTGIEDVGGCFNVQVVNCLFNNITDGTGRAIYCSSTAVALPLSWNIVGCRFINNDNHIVAAASAWTIRFCEFSAVSVTAKINFTGGAAPNSVFMNQLGGTYSIAGGYTSVATDEWSGNFNILAGGVTAALPA